MIEPRVILIDNCPVHVRFFHFLAIIDYLFASFIYSSSGFASWPTPVRLGPFQLFSAVFLVLVLKSVFSNLFMVRGRPIHGSNYRDSFETPPNMALTT